MRPILAALFALFLLSTTVACAPLFPVTIPAAEVPRVVLAAPTPSCVVAAPPGDPPAIDLTGSSTSALIVSPKEPEGPTTLASFPVYAGGLSYPARLHVTPGGILSALFNRDASPLSGGEFQLSAATSVDGGRTWSEPIALSERIPNNVDAWSDTTLPDGTILAYYVTPNGTQEARFHPDTGAVERRLASGFTFGRVAVAALSDGRVILSGWLERDPERPWLQEDRTHLVVWRLETNGSRTDLATFRGGWSRVLATSSGIVEVVWNDEEPPGGPGSHLYRAVSLDGATFSAPQPLGDAGMGPPAALAIDETGTLHALVERLLRVEWHNGTDGDFARSAVSLEYDRFPVVGLATRIAIAGTPDAIFPGSDSPGAPVLVARGPRVWAIWDDTAWDANGRTGRGNGTYVMESGDGAVTFGAPEILRDTHGVDLREPTDLAPVGEGRTLVLAGAYEGGLAVYPHVERRLFREGS